LPDGARIEKEQTAARAARREAHMVLEKAKQAVDVELAI
jgi:hypothetical protein